MMGGDPEAGRSVAVPAVDRDLDRVARDWLVRVQLGDASVPGETAGGRAAALAAFEAWRAADPAHAAAYERVQRSVRMTEHLVGSRMVAESRLSPVSFRQRHPLAVGALAAMLLAGVGISALRLARPENAFHPGAMPQSALAMEDRLYVTRIGEVRSLALPDGSNVLLDADSALRVQYSTGERRLRLDRGRARFTVAHVPARPFVVNAGNGMIIAHGTIFDVALGASGVRVALLRGAISVARQAGGAPSVRAVEARELTAGQQIDVPLRLPLGAPQPLPEAALGWVSGHLAFSDTPLGDAVNEINRYNRRKLVLATPAIAQAPVSGGFDARVPTAFATAAAQVLNLQLATRADGTMVLLPAGKASPP